MPNVTDKVATTGGEYGEQTFLIWKYLTTYFNVEDPRT